MEDFPKTSPITLQSISVFLICRSSFTPRHQGRGDNSLVAEKCGVGPKVMIVKEIILEMSKASTDGFYFVQYTHLCSVFGKGREILNILQGLTLICGGAVFWGKVVLLGCFTSPRFDGSCGLQRETLWSPTNNQWQWRRDLSELQKLGCRAVRCTLSRQLVITSRLPPRIHHHLPPSLSVSLHPDKIHSPKE